MIQRLYAIPVLLLFLSGCWNIENDEHVRFGDVSIGQQMIDLKRALEESAITADEHAELKQALMSISSLCESDDSDD